MADEPVHVVQADALYRARTFTILRSVCGAYEAQKQTLRPITSEQVCPRCLAANPPADALYRKGSWTRLT